MDLFIKNKLVSLGGSSKVLDKDGNLIFKVKGKIFSITRKKLIYDENKNKLFKVRNKFWRFFVKQALIYDSNKELVARVKRRIGVKDDYTIISNNGEYHLKGNIIGLRYDIIKDEEIIGEIKQDITIFADSFQLSCKNDEDAPFLVALIIALDNIKDRK